MEGVGVEEGCVLVALQITTHEPVGILDVRVDTHHPHVGCELLGTGLPNELEGLLGPIDLVLILEYLADGLLRPLVKAEDRLCHLAEVGDALVLNAGLLGHFSLASLLILGHVIKVNSLPGRITIPTLNQVLHKVGSGVEFLHLPLLKSCVFEHLFIGDKLALFHFKIVIPLQLLGVGVRALTQV